MSESSIIQPQPNLHTPKFLLSCATPKDFPVETGHEIAFSGRSNAGKSSTLNRLCNQKSLARVSKTPGRTQMINFFDLNDGSRLADLPGYGFAKVPAAEKRRWQHLIETYLSQRKALKGLIIVMDIRRPLSELDWNMLEWCSHFDIQMHVLLNKSDKLKQGAISQMLKKTEHALKNNFDSISVQAFSASKGTGIDVLHTKIRNWLIE